jgi:hypothetical protein
MFKRLREALERALEAATPPPDLGQIASQMRDAVVEQKAGVRLMREELAKAEEQLAAEQGQLVIAQRRRDLASGINDAETVGVAEKFIARHQERTAMLEKKVVAQREELALAERDLAEMMTQLQEASRRNPALGDKGSSTEAAWNSLGEAGMDRPELDLEHELLKTRAQRAAREAEADARLDEMKKKLGRE